VKNNVFIFVIQTLKAVGVYDYAPFIYYHFDGTTEQNSIFVIKGA
jgi:hypothetical protein